MQKPTAPPGAPPTFFVDQKKGEVNELRVLLSKIETEKDIQKRREVIKKVIAYMTLGIDVSSLFPEMVKASRIDDMVSKKMIYHYLVANSKDN
jgi:AP-4 complex subunit beta-1